MLTQKYYTSIITRLSMENRPFSRKNCNFFCKLTAFWGGDELPQSKPDGFDSSLWEGAFGMTGKFPAQAQSLWACLLPLGGAVAQRLRGFESAEPEKTVKRSSRRTGVNLQFFPVQPTPLGLKGASSPFFVAPARRNRWHFSGSLLVSKENIPRLAESFPAERTLSIVSPAPCPKAWFVLC